MNWEILNPKVNETLPIQIENPMSNLNGSMTLSTNETFVDPNATFSSETSQESKALNLGPILGPCLLFVTILLYLWGKRIENQEEKEKAQEASRREENRRQFLKDHVNVKVRP